MKQKRLYLQYCEKSLRAIKSSIAAFNDPLDEYKIEKTLMLIVNGWELIGKAILIRDKKSIAKDKHGNTISAEEVVAKLRSGEVIDENQERHIAQVISFRNEAAHGILPSVPEEILHQLFYFCCKFYKDIVTKEFPRYRDAIVGNYLSIAFDDLTTYADKVQRLIKNCRKGKQSDMKILWLLERGIRFDGHSYMPQEQFEREFRSKRSKKILSHLQIGKFMKSAEMVRIVPVQAPRGYTADINLRKGRASDYTLPVAIKKTDVEIDYPYLTSEIGLRLKKGSNFMARTMANLQLKGNSLYHQSVRVSKSSKVNRYSDAALHFVQKFLEENISYNPFGKEKLLKASSDK